MQDWPLGAPLPLPDPDQLALLRLDRVYSQTDLPGVETRSGPIRTMRCRTGADGYAVLRLERAREDFRPTVSARLSALAPYLGTTLAQWQRLARERRQAGLSRALAQRLGAGWLLLSPAGRVTEIDTGLRDRLGQAGGARLRPDGSLDFPEAELERQFRAALSRLQMAEGAVVPVTLSHDPAMRMVLLNAGSTARDGAIGLVRHEASARALPPEQLTRTLGLSRSEARLTAHLCDGLTLEEAASALGWTRETARSCSKQVFARLGVRGQSGVLRRVLFDPLWLLPVPN